jgi:hypothetical protein
MSRPPFEVADIVRITGDSFRQRYSAALTWPQRKGLRSAHALTEREYLAGRGRPRVPQLVP